MVNLRGKFALITGGANGIGFNYSNEFLRNGLEGLTIVDINTEGGNKAVKTLTELYGNKVIFAQADVSKPDELEDAFKTAFAHWKQLDVVINNAGVCNYEKWDREIAINCGGIVQGTILGFKYMGKDNGQNGGIIVNIASPIAFLPSPAFPVYAGTKSFTVTFSRCFGTAFHYDRTGVKVLTVCPGATETEILQKSSKSSLSTLIPAIEEIIKEEIESLPFQPPKVLAENVVKFVLNGNNGSVWICAGSECHEVTEWPSLPYYKNFVQYQ